MVLIEVDFQGIFLDIQHFNFLFSKIQKSQTIEICLTDKLGIFLHFECGRIRRNIILPNVCKLCYFLVTNQTTIYCLNCVIFLTRLFQNLYTFSVEKKVYIFCYDQRYKRLQICQAGIFSSTIRQLRRWAMPDISFWYLRQKLSIFSKCSLTIYICSLSIYACLQQLMHYSTFEVQEIIFF